MTPPRALVLVVAVAAGLAAVGCGGSAGGGDSRPRFAAIDQGGERWQALQQTLQQRFDQDATNACVRGATTCVPLVVAEMRRRLDVLARQCSHLAPFALMYLRVTAGVEEAQSRGERFRDLPYLAHLDAVFARFYFRAFDAWRNGSDREVPAAWRLAFEAGERRVVSGIGDLMLGMNAHISRDLPFALAASGLQGTDGQSALPDFNAVNALLNRTRRSHDRRAGAPLRPVGEGLHRAGARHQLARSRRAAGDLAHRGLRQRREADRRADTGRATPRRRGDRGQRRPARAADPGRDLLRGARRLDRRTRTLLRPAGRMTRAAVRVRFGACGRPRPGAGLPR
jgi:hypothetical protein